MLFCSSFYLLDLMSKVKEEKSLSAFFLKSGRDGEFFCWFASAYVLGDFVDELYEILSTDFLPYLVSFLVLY